jgi:hypothetical protein
MESSHTNQYEYDPYMDAMVPKDLPNPVLSSKDMQVGGNHYKDMKIQPTEFIMANDLRWCEGNAVKYICRHRQKGERKDIEKAIHYLQILLEEEYDDKDGSS